MLKGLTITPPIVGRISIGKVVEKNGKRLPEKDDEFTITTQVQTKDGWMLHPLNQSLRKDSNTSNANNKLRSIPVRVMFNDPDLNLRASYHYFDRQTGRPLCVGNGETCKRSTVDGIKELPCPGPDACHMGQGGSCKPYGRLNVLIGEEDELGSFIFRTTGHNSIRTLSARLKYFHAVSGGHLATLPMELRLRGKSTTQSHTPMPPAVAKKAVTKKASTKKNTAVPSDAVTVSRILTAVPNLQSGQWQWMPIWMG